VKVRLLIAVLAFFVSSCGYHLVGQGDGQGAIPEDVESIAMQARDEVARPLAEGLRRQLEIGDGYHFVKTKRGADAEIWIEKASETFVPSAYDSKGIASQYRMTLRAGVVIHRDGKKIWGSGVISVSGDVYVAGGPAGIEASRQRIRRDLQKEWIFNAASRIRSGF